MDKKDIYEHLARIYLDASAKKNKKPLPGHNTSKKIFIAGLAVVIIAAAFTVKGLLRSDEPFKSETSLIIASDTVKINFDFDPAKKETYSLNLNHLDLSRYKSLGFLVKRANPEDKLSLRIEFVSAFKEKSEVYLRDIPAKWKAFNIAFADFQKISDWSRMAGVSFSIEEWNTREKSGVVYIDNIRFLK